MMVLYPSPHCVLDRKDELVPTIPDYHFSHTVGGWLISVPVRLLCYCESHETTVLLFFSPGNQTPYYN